MSTILSPVFPAEIFDIIIDYARDDRHSMAVCALVCRSWVARSRLHLFETIHFRNARETGGSGNYASFLRLLDSPHPSFVTHIFNISSHGLGWAGWLVAPQKELLDEEEKVLRCLPGLIAPRTFTHFLCLDQCRFAGTVAEILRTTFRDITHLDLKEFKFSLNPKNFFRFISLFTKVEKLSISCRMDDLPCEEIYDDCLTPRLWSLSLSCDVYVGEIGWLLRYKWPKLTELRLQNIHYSDMRSLLGLLEYQGDSIRSLGLSFVDLSVREESSQGTCSDLNNTRASFKLDSSFVHPADFISAIDLSRHSHLTSLRLPLKLDNQNPWVLRCLSESEISHVEFLIFHFLPDYLPKGNSRKWDELADILNSPTYSALRKVYFESESKRYSSQKAEAKIRPKLGAWEGGVMSFGTV